ncbi:MAG: tyrosine--tRNA ligase [Candidatus Dormibacteria bacterium]
MSPDQRCVLIERNTAELLTRGELLELLTAGTPVRHYIGFEISGRVHLGAGLVCMAKIRDFLDAGVECSVLLADWHTWINDKLGADPELIRRVATGYFTEALRAGLRCVGADPDRVRFVLASDLYRQAPDYWATVIEVSKNTTLSRMQRSISILGREEGEGVDFAKLIYPAMQAADIFAQGITLAHAGMDQRKAHVIARDVALRMRSRTGGPVAKPVAVHHPLILGLGKPPTWPILEQERREMIAAMKMSKSKPSTAVFIHDDPDVIRRKISRAFCAPRDVTFNPVLDWLRHLVFELDGRPLDIDRAERNGGPVTYAAYSDLEAAFTRGDLHAMDAKQALADRLISRLEPAREHFAKPAMRAMLAEVEELTGASAGR